jgi:hypothetical protein
MLRRVVLDLVGLLPKPELVKAFASGEVEYETIVDQLLDSPHFGERWARHWLDVARYADSDGYTHDDPREMWPYRDWVIDALNQDLPYDCNRPKPLRFFIGTEIVQAHIPAAIYQSLRNCSTDSLGSPGYKGIFVFQ